jgi:hypothetical protein
MEHTFNHVHYCLYNTVCEIDIRNGRDIQGCVCIVRDSRNVCAVLTRCHICDRLLLVVMRVAHTRWLEMQ